MKVALLIATLLAGEALAEDPRVTALVQLGDRADARGDAPAALAALRQAEGIEPANFGVVLRISKVTSDLICRAREPQAGKDIAERALDYGKRAVALDPRSPKAHLNLAVCYSKLMEFAGNKAKLEYARLIHESAQRSVQLDPSDDYAWHVLGRWNAGVANLNGVLRTLATFAFGGLPPASNEEAAKCLKKASDMAPQRIMHHAELAKVYTALDQTDRAAQAWQNVLGIRPVDQQDQLYQKEARGALEGLRPKRTGTGRKFARR